MEATVAAVPGSPLQPVLAPGADPGGPFVWLAELVGLDRLGDALPVASVLGVAAGMAGFLILLRAAWRGDLSIRLALGLSIAFHLAIVLLPLLISRDVYSYIAHGQIVSLHHANPYVQTPADFPGLLSRTLVGPQVGRHTVRLRPAVHPHRRRRHPDHRPGSMCWSTRSG